MSRPNRFISHVEINGRVEVCHVKNTGRCKEILIPGATVYLEPSDNPNRKTAYSLITAKKGSRLINIDSQLPNKVIYCGLENGTITLPEFPRITKIKPESVYGSSRFDFYLENESQRGFIEVKGATLEKDGVVKFPDAPTERGVKHIYELIGAREQGYFAYIIFVIQMNNIKYFTPNDHTHKAFGDALRAANEKGVQILAYECDITPDSMVLNGKECLVVL